VKHGLAAMVFAVDHSSQLSAASSKAAFEQIVVKLW
jgi:hypothetical protein